jgi:hypothetical protein
MSHVFVDYIPSSDGQEDSSGGEVQRVVELILNHARSTPGRTLGVITMGIKHADRIRRFWTGRLPSILNWPSSSTPGDPSDF